MIRGADQFSNGTVSPQELSPEKAAALEIFCAELFGGELYRPAKALPARLSALELLTVISWMQAINDRLGDMKAQRELVDQMPSDIRLRAYRAFVDPAWCYNCASHLAQWSVH